MSRNPIPEASESDGACDADRGHYDGGISRLAFLERVATEITQIGH